MFENKLHECFWSMPGLGATTIPIVRLKLNLHRLLFTLLVCCKLYLSNPFETPLHRHRLRLGRVAVNAI